MTTLVTFGDSHSAGAEMECKGHPGSPERAYPAKIAKHYGWKSINLSTCGGSNAWLWKTFEDCMPILMNREEDLVVLCNFTEISRMYFWDNGSAPLDPYNFEPYRYARHVTTVALDPFHDVAHVRSMLALEAKIATMQACATQIIKNESTTTVEDCVGVL